MAPFVQNMGIDHRRFDIIMAQEFLHRSHIVTAFDQVSRKGMPEARMPSPSPFLQEEQGKVF
jgi:hypothetical protein